MFQFADFSVLLGWVNANLALWLIPISADKPDGYLKQWGKFAFHFRLLMLEGDKSVTEIAFKNQIC